MRYNPDSGLSPVGVFYWKQSFQQLNDGKKIVIVNYKDEIVNYKNEMMASRLKSPITTMKRRQQDCNR